MTDVRMGASVYVKIGFGAYYNTELREWIRDNVDIMNCSYANYGAAPRLFGLYLYPEQATVFKLKFGL
jgi:hypothetical protein